jgi:hypothetical protein
MFFRVFSTTRAIQALPLSAGLGEIRSLAGLGAAAPTAAHVCLARALVCVVGVRILSSIYVHVALTRAILLQLWRVRGDLWSELWRAPKMRVSVMVASSAIELDSAAVAGLELVFAHT